MKNLSDTDVIDIVKRIRQHINALDNIHWLSSKLDSFDDKDVVRNPLISKILKNYESGKINNDIEKIS